MNHSHDLTPAGPDLTDLTDLSVDFDVGRRIGRGGMAEVFAGVERNTGRSVAIKRIMSDLVDHPRMRRRFESEIDLLGVCRGAYVLELVATGAYAAAPAYVAERCSGSLYDLGRVRRMPLPEVLRFSSEILVALDRVHAAGAVHRDIKPSNILVGQDGLTRLADFGIALHPQNRVTAAGHKVGTPAFAAPDLTADPRTAEPTHDLFSLGLLILALSTHLRSAALTDPDQRPVTLRLFPAATADLLARATSGASAERFSSAAEMALAVRTALAEGPWATPSQG